MKKKSYWEAVRFHRDSEGNYHGRCPWHQDDGTLSLCVSDKRGVIHCFACGIGGILSCPPLAGEQVLIDLSLAGKKGKYRIEVGQVVYAKTLSIDEVKQLCVKRGMRIISEPSEMNRLLNETIARNEEEAL